MSRARVQSIAEAWHSTGCPSGKRTYDTRAAAKAAARLLAKKGRGNLRPYECWTCTGWHIGHTKVEQRTRARGFVAVGR